MRPPGKLFLRLITLGEGVEDTRRRVRRAELDLIVGSTGALDKVIVAVRALSPAHFHNDPVTKGPTVEVAHEALIRTWGRLQDWLAQSPADLRVQRQLMVASAEWAAGRKDTSFLASGARLSQFVALAEGADRPGGVALTGAEREYLQASVEERERQERAERERQANELLLQRRAANRLRVLVVALACF